MCSLLPEMVREMAGQPDVFGADTNVSFDYV